MPRPHAPEAVIAAGPQQINPSLFRSAERRRVSGPGLRTFLAVADLWCLTEEERRRVLGSPSRSTYHSWARAVREHRDVTLDLDTLIRISGFLGVYQALRILYSSEGEGLAWLRGPHQATVFGCRSPLELLTSGSQDAILTVRRFLDAARGGLYMAPNEVDVGFEPYRDNDIVLS
jgi:hypothetical protein